MNMVVGESCLRSGKLEESLESVGEVHGIRSEQKHAEYPEKSQH